MSGVKVGGVWRTTGNTYVKVGGVWRTVATVSVKTGGVWHNTDFTVPPAAPIMGWVSYGIFNVTNPVAGAVYTPTLISGGAGASWDEGNKRFTLSSTVARFSVTAGWGATSTGIPQSAPDYMDRQARTVDSVWIDFSQCSNPCGNCRTDVNPHTWSCGCGSGCNDSGGGQWGDCICRGPGYWTYPDHSYAGAGYTDGGSEWWKVS